MMKIKLILGNSYSDGVVFVKREKPIIDVSKEEGQKLLNTGYFELIEETPYYESGAEDDAPEDEEVSEDDAPEEQEYNEYIISPVDFDTMTINELKAYAEENDIDINGLTKKPEIKQALLDDINSRVPKIFTE